MRGAATDEEARPKGRGLMATSLAAVALMGIGIWRFQRMNALPDLVIPAPVMPVPNAYDDYVHATGLTVSFIGGGDATGEPSTSTGRAKTARGGPLPPVSARLRLVALNDNTVRALREGFTHSYLQPPDRSPTGSSSLSFTYFATARSLARMLAFSSRTYLDAKRADKAADYGLDGVRFAADLPRGGSVITRLVARACEAVAHQPLWEVAKTCDAATARTAARRLEEIERNRYPVAETFREEKYIGLTASREVLERDSLYEISKNIAARRGTTTGGGGAATLSPIAVASVQAQILLKGRSRILRDYDAYMNRVIAVSRLPYGAHTSFPHPPSDPFNKDMALSDMDTLILRDTESQMLTRLLAVRFALRAYHLERGAYPQTLAELVQTGYLRAVPGDPFAAPATAGALPPLGYHRATGKGADGFVLYSVGPDSRDNGGKPINNPYGGALNKGSRQKNFVEAGTTGDFVVGVNAY